MARGRGVSETPKVLPDAPADVVADRRREVGEQTERRGGQPPPSCSARSIGSVSTGGALAGRSRGGSTGPASPPGPFGGKHRLAGGPPHGVASAHGDADRAATEGQPVDPCSSRHGGWGGDGWDDGLRASGGGWSEEPGDDETPYRRAR